MIGMFFAACEMNIHIGCIGLLTENCQGSRRKKQKSSLMESLRFKRKPTGVGSSLNAAASKIV